VTLEAHAARATSVDLGGDVLASAGQDGAIRLWDPARRRQLGPPLVRHPGDSAAVALSANGRTLVTTGGNGAVRL